ncbi:MAG: hypothetical protein IPM97_03340 [Bdellovibrionaceae bacterium]|nr:hypothetical protein [Pseudobdellovibrionaceae bacterium]
MKAIFQVFFKFIATTFFSISAIASHVELEKSAYNGFPNSLSGRDFFEKRSPPVSNETLKQPHFKAHAQSEVILLVVTISPKSFV